MEQLFQLAIKQFTKFIGGKFDALSTTMKDGFTSLSSDIKSNKQSVTLSLNSEAIDALRDGTQQSLDKVTLALSKVSEVEAHHLKTLVATLKEISQAVRADVADGEALRKQMMKVVDLISIAEKILAKIPESQSYKSELASILAAIKALKLEVQPTDLSPVVASLEANQEALNALQNAIKSTDARPGIQALTEAILALKIQVPNNLTFKLDDTQLRSIRGGSTGGGVTVAGPLTATSVTIVNRTLALAANEYSYTFPANTLSWTIKLRDQGTLAYYSFTTGKLPTSGDSSLYATIPQNFLQSKEGVEWSGKTIYLGAEADGQIAEITVYTL